MAEASQPDRDIGLGAADMHVQLSALEQQFPPRRGQTQQQLAEAQDPFRQSTLPFACMPNASSRKLVTGFHARTKRRKDVSWRAGSSIILCAMLWLALPFAALLQATPPTVPAPATQAPARPALRPRPPRADDRIYRLFFDWDDVRVTGEGLTILDQAADDYRRNGRASVEIVTGADESGRNAYNQLLSARRARAVANGLVRLGVPRTALRLRPMGIHRPLVATGSGIREPMNRYAEISFPVPVLR